MGRRPPTSSVELALLSLVADAAPAPKDREPVTFFPSTKGSKWVTERAGQEVVSVITDVVRREGWTHVTIETAVDGQVALNKAIRITDAGLFSARLPAAASKDDEVCIFRLPYKPGANWRVEDNAAKNWGAKFTAGVADQVTVSAGVFEAVNVTCVYDFGYASGSVTDWFAPGVGIVKTVDRRKDGDIVTVLKSFTPGKD